MRRLLVTALGILLAASILFTGCGSGSGEQEEQSRAATPCRTSVHPLPIQAEVGHHGTEPKSVYGSQWESILQGEGRRG